MLTKYAVAEMKGAEDVPWQEEILLCVAEPSADSGSDDDIDTVTTFQMSRAQARAIGQDLLRVAGDT